MCVALLVVVAAYFLALVPAHLSAQTSEMGVDLIWDAATYTPVTYAGKALPTAGARVQFQAVPYRTGSGSVVDPGSLTFTWSVDGRRVVWGVGEDMFTFSGGSTRSHTVSVSVNRGDATASFDLSPRSPEVVLYEESPLYGTRFSSVLNGTFSLEGQEKTFNAVPFHFTVPNSASPELLYRWSINGEPVERSRFGPESAFLTVRQIEQNNGVSRVSVLVEKLNSLYQSASTQLSVRYGR